jgi:tetratricopeptide (TPR) repeat protein
VASPIPVEVKSEWRNKLIALARKNWARYGNNISPGHPMRHDVMMLTLAAACTWANNAEAADKAHSRHRTQRLLWRINRRQRALVWIGVGMAAAFIIWLISVQLRTSLPEAAFRTRVGMIQQHYQSGEFDIAMEKLAELERRQSISEHIILFVRGKIQFKLGEIDSAIESFNHALEIEPAHAATRFNLGLCYFRKTDYGRARDLFTGLATDVALTHPATASRAKKAAELCMIITNGEASAE